MSSSIKYLFQNPVMGIRVEEQARKIAIKLTGFCSGARVAELNIDDSTRVEEVLHRVLGEEAKEVMVICGTKQLYSEDIIPRGCFELEIYPLASGG